MISLAFWLVGLPIILWVAFCAVVWIGYFLFGQSSDSSGDLGAFVFVLPALPIYFAYHKICELCEYLRGSVKE